MKENNKAKITYSKSFYVVIACLVIIMMFYVYIHSIKNAKLLLILLFITPILVYAFYIMMMNFVLPGILQRVSGTVDLTSGRTSIWPSYFQMLFNEPITLLLGAGVGNAKNLIVPFYGKAQAAHNAYLEMLSDTGIIGCVLLLNTYKDGLKKIISCVKNQKMAYFYIFMITAMSLSFSAYDTVYFMVPILQFVNTTQLQEEINDQE